MTCQSATTGMRLVNMRMEYMPVTEPYEMNILGTQYADQESAVVDDHEGKGLHL